MAIDIIESAQLTEILRQLEAIRYNMFAIVECQNDIQLILKEDDKLRVAAQKEKQIRKVRVEDNSCSHEDWSNFFDFSEAYGRQQDKQQDDTKKYNQYVFCADVESKLWHIRVNTDGFHLVELEPLERGVAMLSLCERKMTYSIGWPVSKESLSPRVCETCEDEYLRREGEESNGDEETNQRGEAKG